MLKVLKWKPRGRKDEDERDTLAVPHADVTQESSHISSESDHELRDVHDGGTGSEKTSQNGETSATEDITGSQEHLSPESACGDEESVPKDTSSKSPTSRRRKFRALMRGPMGARSVDSDTAVTTPQTQRKHGKKNFFISHMRALSVGHHHRLKRQEEVALAVPPSVAKSHPALLLTPPEGETSGVGVTRIDVTDVDGTRCIDVADAEDALTEVGVS